MACPAKLAIVSSFLLALEDASPSMALVIDAHEDLAWNMLTFGRDYTRSAIETRRLEEVNRSLAPMKNGHTLLGWPDYQNGQVAIVFASLFATPTRLKRGDWEILCYTTPEEAWQVYHRQLEAYHALVETHPERFVFITTRHQLQTLLLDWQDKSRQGHPVGFVVLMEGGEGIRTPSELEQWWEEGVRIVGPAWARTRYCGGTNEPGPLTAEGRELLEVMAELRLTLDVSHMDEAAARQAIDRYEGPIIASHANAAACVPGYEGNRLLSDELICQLINRDAIIGIVPYCRFLQAGWRPSDGRDGITLDTVAIHIDHICQLAGDAQHVGLGSDFDGGFGVESAPADVDTVADLQKLSVVLAKRGYSERDIAAILGDNWLRHLRENLP